MMTLFGRSNTSELLVDAVRGNHDCAFDDDEWELRRSDDHPQWYMPSFYYTKEVEVGANGEKLGLLMVDSCLMLCADYQYSD